MHAVMVRVDPLQTVSTVVLDHGREKKREFVQLPAFKWAEVYRALRPFLRPFGESGEGRLDFYHRSLSKAVRRKYFTLSNGEQDDAALRWWHKKLAKYFDIQCVNFQRKLEVRNIPHVNLFLNTLCMCGE